MIPFFSKRNQVYPVLRQNRPAVEKHFADMEDWARETSLYAALAGRISLVPALYTEPGLLVTEYVSLPTLLDTLEAQERTGFSPEPWLALTSWIRRCFDSCGQLPSDGNLRNFLWDASEYHVLGLDLEGFRPLSLEQSGALLAAAALTYDPADTVVKRQAAGVLVRELQISDTSLAEAQRRLADFRRGKAWIPMSGVVLAGGASRRMGTCKAELELEGKALLDWQVEKMQALGIKDILLSGKDCFPIPGARVVADEYPDRGPLGGLYSCFRAARHTRCLILSVDTPLVPAAALAKLCRTHTKGEITCLRHAGKPEPLIGVYDTDLKNLIGPLIKEKGAAVRTLERLVPYAYFDYLGPAEYLLNCNTPRQFIQIQRLVKSCMCHQIIL